MINKNEFKIKFSQWVLKNKNAPTQEAKRLCESLLPAESRKKFHWLITESIAWFEWLKEDNKRLERRANEDFEFELEYTEKRKFTLEDDGSNEELSRENLLKYKTQRRQLL